MKNAPFKKDNKTPLLERNRGVKKKKDKKEMRCLEDLAATDSPVS